MSLSLALVLLAEAAVVSDAARPPEVTIQNGADSALLADSKGLTLYFREGPEGCTGDCLRAWPPFMAEAQASEVGDWKKVAGPGGGLQWSFRGSPIYTFAADGGPGLAGGDGLGGIGGRWRAIRYMPELPKLDTPSAAAVGRLGKGFVLTNAAGFTLYTARQASAKPGCSGECLQVWKPLRAPALAVPVGEWKPVERFDGLRQWAYRGKLVYTFDGDLKPGETRGADPSGIWQALTYSPGPDSKTDDRIAARNAGK